MDNKSPICERDGELLEKIAERDHGGTSRASIIAVAVVCCVLVAGMHMIARFITDQNVGVSVLLYLWRLRARLKRKEESLERRWRLFSGNLSRFLVCSSEHLSLSGLPFVFQFGLLDGWQ